MDIKSVVLIEEPISVFHQGQRLGAAQGPDVWQQSLPRRHQEVRAWQTGATMYVRQSGPEPHATGFSVE
jgi:hypothetical protein